MDKKKILKILKEVEEYGEFPFDEQVESLYQLHLEGVRDVIGENEDSSNALSLEGHIRNKLRREQRQSLEEKTE